MAVLVVTVAKTSSNRTMSTGSGTADPSFNSNKKLELRKFQVPIYLPFSSFDNLLNHFQIAKAHNNWI